MSRISNGEFKGVKLDKGDTVIFSSWKIPGNEKEINEIQNRFIANGVNVIEKANCGDDLVHVSHGGDVFPEENDMLAIE